jgi:hypothetical protein
MAADKGVRILPARVRRQRTASIAVPSARRWRRRRILIADAGTRAVEGRRTRSWEEREPQGLLAAPCRKFSSAQ